MDSNCVVNPKLLNECFKDLDVKEGYYPYRILPISYILILASYMDRLRKVLIIDSDHNFKDDAGAIVCPGTVRKESSFV